MMLGPGPHIHGDPMRRSRILLVEDDAQLRASLARLLDISGYDVTCHTSAETLLAELSAPSAQAQPLCVLMDVNLTGLSGVQAQTVLRQQHPDMPVIFISAELNAHHVNQAWREGAAEFLFKPFAPESLMLALEKVTARRASVGVVRSGDAQTPAEAAQARLIQSLTARQLQVLEGLVQGHSNTRIAERLHISARTVKMHREGIMRRLGLRHLADLVRYYEQHKSLFPRTPVSITADFSEDL